MIEKSIKNKIRPDLFAVGVFLISFFFHAWNIGYDLPNLYHQDEPHHLHIAAHFGTGDLNPHDFKYPTLWSYVLSVLLGFLFVAGKWLGLTQTPLDFASAFFHTPTVFYLSARLTSNLFFSLGAMILYWTGKKFHSRLCGLAAGLFLALSPSMFQFGREATMNSLMVFFICLSLYFVHGLIITGSLRDTLISGFIMGLGLSSHYIAAPVALLLPGAYLIRGHFKNEAKPLLLGLIAVGFGFIAGSPYLLLDFAQARSDIFSMGQLHIAPMGQLQANELATRPGLSLALLLESGKNLIRFIDPWGLGFAFLILGIMMARDLKSRLQLLMWTCPALALLTILFFTYHGNYYRYSLGVYIPLIIPTAAGFTFLMERFKTLRLVKIALALAIFLPWIWNISRYANNLSLLDSRTAAQKWIFENVPQGEKVFVMDPYYCPQLPKSKDQVLKLLKITQTLNHPRQHYYEALAHHHPNIGYEVITLRRTLNQVEDLPRRTEKSYEAQETIDLNAEGISALNNSDIKTAVVVLFENDPHRPEWIKEIPNKFQLVSEFRPEVRNLAMGKQVLGAWIQIYQR
ncbi:MAG: hypothetical protein KCHDKBKB_01384 [Elusimicrobia bacterium]|nr:hypothetical protein [Elusimicrobiota bacterium]